MRKYLKLQIRCALRSDGVSLPSLELTERMSAISMRVLSQRFGNKFSFRTRLAASAIQLTRFKWSNAQAHRHRHNIQVKFTSVQLLQIDESKCVYQMQNALSTRAAVVQLSVSSISLLHRRPFKSSSFHTLHALGGLLCSAFAAHRIWMYDNAITHIESRKEPNVLWWRGVRIVHNSITMSKL